MEGRAAELEPRLRRSAGCGTTRRISAIAAGRRRRAPAPRRRGGTATEAQQIAGEGGGVRLSNVPRTLAGDPTTRRHGVTSPRPPGARRARCAGVPMTLGGRMDRIQHGGRVEPCAQHVHQRRVLELRSRGASRRGESSSSRPRRSRRPVSAPGSGRSSAIAEVEQHRARRRSAAPRSRSDAHVARETGNGRARDASAPAGAGRWSHSYSRPATRAGTCEGWWQRGGSRLRGRRGARRSGRTPRSRSRAEAVPEIACLHHAPVRRVAGHAGIHDAATSSDTASGSRPRAVPGRSRRRPRPSRRCARRR